MENQEMRFCQSCAMPLDQDELRGTEADGSLSPDYCKYCYQNGAFTREQTIEQAIENDLPFVLKAGVYPDADTARREMLKFYPTLKRWKRAD